MIPNCRGCKYELEEAYEWQERGYNVIIDNMGVRKHCFIKVLDKEDKIILE